MESMIVAACWLAASHQHEHMRSTKACGLPSGISGRHPVMTLQMICTRTHI